MISNDISCDQSGVRITRASASQVLVTTRRKLYLVLVYCFTFLTAGVCALGFTSLVVMAFTDPDAPLSGMLCVGLISLPLVVLMIAAWLLSIVGFYLAVRQRRFLIDVDSRTCTFRGAPGLSCEIPFDEIQSVSLCSGHDRYWHLCWLCFSIAGWKRFLRIQSIARLNGSDEFLLNEFRPVAEMLCKLIDCPIEIHENVTAAEMAWR